jgi:4-hydroxythreonine-4-phosphate dehydrogenase
MRRTSSYASSASRHLPRLVVTPGEPAGIGPDILLALMDRRIDADLIACADPELMRARAAQLGRSLRIQECDPASPRATANGALAVLPVRMGVRAQAGRLDRANAQYVLACLDRAIDGCVAGEFDALVTGPVQKSIINEAGIPFTGHTEYLAARTHASRPVMMLTDGTLRVALATTHMPLSAVPASVTVEVVVETARVLHRDLTRLYGIAHPRILVCGLNPHAGERGALGNEEIDVILPALEALRRDGIEVTGPVPADTAFTVKRLGAADAVLTMYHDQGLPVLKARGFGHAVNVTLGLPIIRTSVDHGTALDLAGSGNADAGSMLAAIREAIRLTEAAKRVER